MCWLHALTALRFIKPIRTDKNREFSSSYTTHSGKKNLLSYRRSHGTSDTGTSLFSRKGDSCSTCVLVALEPVYITLVVLEAPACPSTTRVARGGDISKAGSHHPTNTEQSPVASMRNKKPTSFGLHGSKFPLQFINHTIQSFPICSNTKQDIFQAPNTFIVDIFHNDFTFLTEVSNNRFD
jgi:hypothetical protein